MRTDLTMAEPAGVIDAIRATIPLGREAEPAEPAEMASAVLFLASSMASYGTLSVPDVAGGRHIRRVPNTRCTRVQRAEPEHHSRLPDKPQEMSRMSHYHEPQDSAYTRVYKAETPDILAAFDNFDSAVFQAEGRAIPLKYRELMAIAVSLTTQCVYCIDFHTSAAKKAGATDGELAEAAWVATAIRAGGAYTHGQMAFKFAAKGSN
jgi:AhpD family alkylhydroperoxidase